MNRRSLIADLGDAVLQSLLVIACLALPTASSAKTRHVPAEYRAIHSAIQAAVTGDTVLVQEGLYGTDFGSWFVIKPGIVILAAGRRDETIWEIPYGLLFQEGDAHSVLDVFFPAR